MRILKGQAQEFLSPGEGCEDKILSPDEGCEDKILSPDEGSEEKILSPDDGFEEKTQRQDRTILKEKDEDLQTGVYTPHPAAYHLPAGRPIPRQPADLDQSTEYYNDDGDDKAPHACDDDKCDEQSVEDAGNGEKPRKIGNLRGGGKQSGEGDGGEASRQEILAKYEEDLITHLEPLKHAYGVGGANALDNSRAKMSDIQFDSDASLNNVHRSNIQKT